MNRNIGLKIKSPKNEPDKNDKKNFSRFDTELNVF